ncbi:S-adenosyl-L-methionine-dependent methyltransferase [Auriculariales sp. MPI-PUGE-AT-0066]|nr:S-adenosyl-L-methionine-dependent methyltransferase [Auriculariales sp. MPI-PUGE-AT-0066]
MATFAKATFSAASYAIARPSYPKALFNRVLAFHRGQQRLCVDLGSGTGQVTLEPQLRRTFGKVLGCDPSAAMVARASELAKTSEHTAAGLGAVEFVQGQAEQLDAIVQPDTVDLVVAGQAGHWFDWPKVWPQIAKALAPGGTYAFWVYSEFVFTGRPELTELIVEYTQGDNWPESTRTSDSLGGYWEQPGRYQLTTHLRHIPEPVGPELVDQTRVHFTGELFAEYVKEGTAEEVEMRRTTTWEGLEAYLRTFSSLHTFHEEHPEDKARRVEGVSVHAEGDIVQRFLARVRERARGSLSDETFEIEWPLVILLGRRQ